ncbi:MAG: hypothetical protein GF313_10460 [Caldithrix sp.]|nr:hypothetical protein [Caldithrix sp.]
MLKVGLLKELKHYEGRVMLTPEAVKLLVKNGIEVFVENGAGESCKFDDIQYERAGAVTLPTMEKVLGKAELILQVQPPMPIEYELISENHIVISFMNLVQKTERVQALLDTRGTYITVELLQDQQGSYPVLMGMSEIAGKMAIYEAARLLTIATGGKGKLLSGTSMTKPSVVTVLGAGMVGRTVVEHALNNQLKVNLLSLKPQKNEGLKRQFPKADVRNYSIETLREVLPHTDVLVIAVYSLKQSYDIFIDRDTVNLMEKGSVLIDISVEQANIVETSHITNHEQSSYVLDGIVHYCVPNIASIVPQTASRTITKNSISFIKTLAREGLSNALVKEPGILPALTMYKGKITNRKFADLHGFEFYNIFELMELNL